MRVLYLTFDDLSRPYAWSVHVRAIVNGLAERGHDVRLLCPRGVAPGIDVPAEALAPGRWGHFVSSFGAAVRAARSQRSDVLYVRGIHLSATPVLAAELLGRPLVVEVNGLLEHEVRGAVRKAAVRAAHRFALARTARVVTVSPLLADAIARDYGYPPRKIDVVSNGADIRRFRPEDREEARRRLGLPKDRAIVTCVASFYPHHAREVLEEACAAAGVLLVLVGGEARSGDGVLGVGTVPHERVPDYLAAADLCAYVLRAPDRSFGFSPLKVYEAMAAGRAVVAGVDLPEVRDFINSAGIGVAANLDARALGEAMRSLLRDPDRRARMGARGRALAEAEFNWDRAAAQVERSLQDAVRA